MISTPHIVLQNERGFARTVLMPGDPRRSEYLARTFLTDAVLVNDVRGVHGYTGTYRGIPVSVMASGMGMPSIGIYSYELFHYFGVQQIIRIGSAGALDPSLKLLDVVAGIGACTNSNFAANYALPGTFAPTAGYRLLRATDDCARERGLNLRVGNLLSSDTFYNDAVSTMDWQKMGVLAVEMEAAALYMNAARAGKQALALCTISDLIYTKAPELSAEERERSMNDMITLALDVAVRTEQEAESV